MDIQWIICSSCQLKHRRRPEATCPRCGSSVDVAPADTSVPLPDAVAYPSPLPTQDERGLSFQQFQARQAAKEDEEDAYRTPMRLAGGALILNAALVLLEKLLIPKLSSVEVPVSAGVASATLDIVLGGALLLGRSRFRALVALRVVLGMVFYIGLHLANREVLSAAMQFILSSALMMLLGRPGVVRMGAGVVGAGLCLLLEGIALHSLHTGRLPFGGGLMVHAMESEPVTDGFVEGREIAYNLTLPGQAWQMRRVEAASRDNPRVDRWLVQPQYGAHLLIMAQPVPRQSQVNMASFSEAVFKELGALTQEFNADEPLCTLNNRVPTCSLHATGSSKGVPVDFEVRLFATVDMAYYLVAYGPSKGFAQVRPEVEAALDSFVIP